MPHKGEILEVIARKKSRSLSELADKMDYDRATLYRHFKDPDLSDTIILHYAKALKYDFSKEFPDLASYTNLLQEPLGEYTPLTISEALKQVDYWRTKYIDLLEKHNALLNDMISEK